MSHFEGPGHIRLQLERAKEEKLSLENALEKTRDKHPDLKVWGKQPASFKTDAAWDPEKAQDALRESEERYKALLEHINDPIWSLDKEYKLIKFNTSFSEWLSHTFHAEATEGIDMLEVMMNSKNFWKELYDYAFAGEHISQVFSLEINGSPRFYKLTINPVRSNDKNIRSLSVVSRDITEEKKSQLLKDLVYSISDASQSSLDLTTLAGNIHRELSSFMDASCFFMALYDERSKQVSFPYKKDDVRPSWIYESREFNRGFCEYALRAGKPLLMREKDLRKIKFIDYERFFKAASAKCTIAVPIKVSGRIAGVMILISFANENAYNEKDVKLLGFLANQVGHTLEKQASQEALVKSEAYFRSLTENTSDLIVILDKKGCISYISGSAEPALGYTPAELRGMEFQKLCKRGERSEEKKKFARWVRKRGKDSAREIEVLHKDGSSRILELVMNNLLHDPHVKGIIINAHDVTERKRYENILKQISEEISGVTGDDFFEGLARKLSHALDGDHVFVGKLSDDEESIETIAFYGEGKKIEPVAYALRHTPCDQVIKKGLFIHPSRIRSRFPKDKYLKEIGVESYAGTVLRDLNGNAIGILGVLSKHEIDDIEVTKSLVTLFGTRAAGELERQRSVKRLEALHLIDKAILGSGSIKEVSNIALSYIDHFVRRFSRASVSMFNFKKQEIHYISTRLKNRSSVSEGKKLPVSMLRDLKKLQQGQPVKVSDLRRLKKISSLEQTLLDEGTVSYIVHPLFSKGQLVGALGLGSNVPGFYHNQDLSGVAEIASQLSLAIQDAAQTTALRNSEQKNRAILNAIPDIMFHFDKKGKFLGYKADLSQLAITPEKFMGKTVFEVYDRSFADESMKCIKATIRTREVQMMEYKMDSSSNETRYYEARFLAGANEDVLCLVRDISDRKKAEIALQESQRTYSVLMRNLPGMVYRCQNDKKWTAQYVNEAAYDLTGYRPEQFTSGEVFFADIIHPEDRKTVWDSVQYALANKTNFTLNYRIITAEKKVKWVWEQGSGVYSDDGKLEILKGFIIDITMQKKYAQRLRFSDDILSRMGSLVVAGRANGEVSYVSPSVERILGYKPEELQGKKWLELSSQILHQDTSGAGDIPHGGYVNPIVTKSGETRWISWEHSISTDGTIIGVGQDITLRREAEMQLVKSNEIISLIINNIDDVIYSVKLLDGKRIMEYISPQIKQVLGYSYEEYIELINSARRSTWVHRDDLMPILNAQKKLRQKQGVTFSYRFKHKETGAYVWIEETVTPRVDAEGKYIGDFGTLRDITARKRSEEELQLFNSVVKSTSEGILITDPNQFDNPVIYANPAFYQLTGYHPGEVIGRNCRFLSGKDTSPDVTQQLKLALKAGAFFDGELLNYKKDGTPFWNYLTVSPIFNSEGRLTHFVGLIKDITERKDAEQMLQEKNHEMNNFVYKASHDLKGPLASIIGVTNLAMTEVNDEYALKFVHFVNDSTKRLDSILQDLLEISRVTHSSVKIEKVNVEKLANEIVFSLKHAEHSRNVNFNIQVTGKNYIYTDRKILMSVLQNLVDNAIKYKNDRLPDPKVEVLVNDYKHGLMVEVKDNGVGIPDKLQAKVFDMFFRGSERSKGTGLGLYIVKNSIKKLGGFVDFYSREMEGSSFNIYIPDLKNRMT